MSILDQAREVEEEPTIPDDIPLMELADKVVRGKLRLTPQQQRMLIEMLPYIAPKLSAVAHAHFDFAAELEKATIERAWERSWSAKAPQLNGPVQELPASEAAKPMQRYRRF